MPESLPRVFAQSYDPARTNVNFTFEPNKNLIDLEHFALRESLTNYEENGPNNLQSWLNQYWHLTALPQ